MLTARQVAPWTTKCNDIILWGELLMNLRYFEHREQSFCGSAPPSGPMAIRLARRGVRCASVWAADNKPRQCGLLQRSENACKLINIDGYGLWSL